MSFRIIRSANEGLQIGNGIVVRVINAAVDGDRVLLSIDAPFGTPIERLENIEAGFTTSVVQRAARMEPEAILNFVKEAEQVCDTKERQRLMIRGLPTFASLSDEAIDAFILAVQ